MSILGKKSGGLYAGYKDRGGAGKREEEKGVKKIGSRSPQIGRADVFVFSLEHGTGTSYIAASIANHMSSLNNGHVSLILEDDEYAEEIVRPEIEVSSWEEEGEIYAASDVIVRDGGVFEDMDTEKHSAMMRATVRILVCRADGWFFKKLARFEESRDNGNMVYLFNQPATELERRIYDVMNFTDDVYCLPTFYSKAIPSLVGHVFQSLLRR